MTHRILAVVIGLVLVLGATQAQAQPSFDVNLGGFVVRAEDGRVTGDVLAINRQYLIFELSDFAAFYGEAALSVELGRYFEGSIGVGAFQRTVPTIYADYVHDDGREIEQDLKLRNFPVTATLRIFPFGQRQRVQTYVGVGVAMNFWRYSETGEFIDFRDDSIFREAYVATGSNAGPIGSFGVRARVTHQVDIGGEFRYHWAEGALDENFLGDKIDLGGYSLLGTFKFRF